MHLKHNYDGLVLPCGGIQGFAILGVLQYLKDNHYLNHIKIYVGTSVGSIIGYLLSIGCSPIEIFVEVWKYNLMEKISQTLNYTNLLENKGLIQYEVLETFLINITKNKINDILTLEDLYIKYNKELICCSYNYTLHQVEYLSYKTHPHLLCLDAIHMSSNIPFVFDHYKYNNCFYIDGGIYNGFPINYLNPNESSFLGIQIENCNYPLDLNNLSFIQSLLYLRNLLLIPICHLEKQLHSSNMQECDIIKLNLDSNLILNFYIGIIEALELFSFGYNCVNS
jgi:predicted acylesterase/phospholipase RssA